MFNSMIFLQAPVKMAAVLNCYEHERSLGHSVTIILPSRLQNMVDFIKCLNISCEIIVLENMIHSSLLNFIANKLAIAKNEKLLSVKEGDNCRFFFTDLFDPDMALILNFVNKYRPVHIQSKLDIDVGCNYEKLQEGVSLVRKFLAKIFFSIYHSRFVACKVGSYSFYTFDNRKYSIPAIDYSETSVIDRYRIRTINDSGKSVIFFSNPNAVPFCSNEEYGKVCEDVILYLKNRGYFVAVKGHPRLGSERHVNALCDYAIPNYIPAEFIDLSQFDFAIGFFSTALCNASFKIKAYSLMNMPKISNETLYKSCMSYFDRCDNMVVFIEKLDDIV